MDGPCPRIVNLNSLGNLRTGSEAPPVCRAAQPLLLCPRSADCILSLPFGLEQPRPQHKPHNGSALQSESGRRRRFCGMQTVSSSRRWVNRGPCREATCSITLRQLSEEVGASDSSLLPFIPPHTGASGGNHNICVQSTEERDKKGD